MPEFKNPNQAGGGGHDSQSILVMIIVMFAAFVGLELWQSQHNPKTAPPDAVTQTAAPSSAATPAGPASATPAAASASAQSPAAAQTIQAATESDTIVENELYRITFSNRGAQVTSWILRKFKDSEGHPLDLVHDVAARKFGYPLSLYTYDPGLTKSIDQALYVVSTNGATPSTGGAFEAPATIAFTYAAGNIAVHKTFTFGADYVLHADAVVTRDGAPLRALLAWPAGFGDMETLQAYASAQVDTSTNGKDKHDSIKSTIGGATLNGPFDFAGVSDQYFAAMFMPDQPEDATLATLHNQIDVKDVPRGSGRSLPSFSSSSSSQAPVLGAAVGDLSGHDQVRLFVGPKALPVLKSIRTANGNSLEPVLDFGFFGPIGKYLFIGLQLVHTHIASNWGWAIILFTVFINLILLPLRVQSMKSALKMQRIQPQIDAIKAKYKNPKPTDPKMAEMNAEVMAYQKEQGVSMFGGCIPSLIQLPLLFAFFTMMTRVVELRQAHWYWLHDLSAADPYKILPIVMMITSFLVQFYTPSPGVDPQQQRMMAFMMPAFSGYMTWNYASGLALYWNVGNLIMIAQQAVMNRTALGREMRELQKKRALRKAGVKPNAKPGQGNRISK